MNRAFQVNKYLAIIHSVRGLSNVYFLIIKIMLTVICLLPYQSAVPTKQ